jgi:RimJ/RimL family protein N-acetyltransferase
MGLEMLTLTAFASNKRAIHVYEKAGFKQVGVVPKAFLKDNLYVDQVIMVRVFSDD